MTFEMVVGNCHLCGQRAELLDSHIWPRFAYKRYTSDLSKGGSFLDLSKGKLSNWQYKRPWFCSRCEATPRGGAYVELSLRPTVEVVYEMLIEISREDDWIDSQRTLYAEKSI